MSVVCRTGTAAQIRSQVSAAFSVGGSFPDGSGGPGSSAVSAVSFLPSALGSPSSSLTAPFTTSAGMVGVTDTGRSLVSLPKSSDNHQLLRVQVEGV